MNLTVIKEGDKTKQGNFVCPQCGKVILLKDYYGDPPKCDECNTLYKPIQRFAKWE